MLDEGERYLKTLGSSGVTDSYCIEAADGRRLVLKVLRLANVDRWKAVELFEREAEVLQNLDHPGIPAYVDFRTDIEDLAESDETGAVTLTVRREWVPGESMQSRLDASTPRPVLDAAELGDFLGEGLNILAYLHSQNPPVVHRDVTPEHWIAAPEGGLKLVGFGSLQSMLPQTRGGSTFVGTRGYIPVEQMMGRAVPASDLYGLAATAVHMVTGQHPGDLVSSDETGTLRTHLEEAEVNSGHISLLESMLEPQPGERPPDAKAAKRRLDESAALAEASNYDIALIDTPPPEKVDARVDASSESDEIRLTLPREGYSTKQWIFSAAGMLVGIGFTASYTLAGSWVIAASMGAVFLWGFLKTMRAVVGTNRLAFDGSTLESKGRILGHSGQWSMEDVDAIDWGRDEDDRSFYCVDLEVDGSTHTIASRLSRPRAVWLADFLQRLRTRRLPDDTRTL